MAANIANVVIYPMRLFQFFFARLFCTVNRMSRHFPCKFSKNFSQNYNPKTGKRADVTVNELTYSSNPSTTTRTNPTVSVKPFLLYGREKMSCTFMKIAIKWKINLNLQTKFSLCYLMRSVFYLGSSYSSLLTATSNCPSKKNARINYSDLLSSAFQRYFHFACFSRRFICADV